MSNKGEGRSSADNHDQLIQARERAEDMAVLMLVNHVHEVEPVEPVQP